MTTKVLFRGEVYTVMAARFVDNDRVCVVLVGNPDDPSDYVRVSVNVPDIALAADETIVKDYSENAGVLAALAAAGVLAKTGRVVEGGFVRMPVCRVLVALPSYDP